MKENLNKSESPHQLHPSLAALIEVGILFLPGIPAFFWLWPNVAGTPWVTAANALAYLYLLVGSLWIGLRRWNLAQLGFNRQGLGLSLVCGLALFAGRTLVITAVQWPREPDPLTLSRAVGDILFYFGLVALIEEYIFRGLVYRALDEWRGARWAIWGSTAGFILFHISWHSPLQLLAALIIGLIFAAVRWRAGGIVGLIFTHGLIDVGAVWLLPELHLEELGRPEISHPGYLLLGYAFILGVPLYLWLVHPRLSQAKNKAAVNGPVQERSMTMNNQIPIPREIALELCENIRRENRGKWYTFTGLMCWGCATFTGGNPLKRCAAGRPDFRGCFQVNARFDALYK